MKHPGGFILLELLVSVVILAVGIVFIIDSLSFILSHEERLNNDALAAFTAQTVISRLSAGGVSEHRQEIFMGEKQFFVELEESAPTDKLRQIVIHVSWHERRRERRLSFAYIVTQTKFFL